MYRLSDIKIRDNLSEEQVIDIALKKYKINKNDVKNAYINKRSVDARNKNDIFFNYSLSILYHVFFFSNLVLYLLLPDILHPYFYFLYLPMTGTFRPGLRQWGNVTGCRWSAY